MGIRQQRSKLVLDALYEYGAAAAKTAGQLSDDQGVGLR